MKKVLVRYKVKENKVAENEQLVKAVYRQIHELQPEGIRYSTYKLADGVSFIHIGIFETEAANNTFSNLPAFKNFLSGVKDRCEEQPVSSTMEVVGSYGFGEK